MPRRFVTLVVTALVLVPVAGCTGDDPGGGVPGSAPRLPLREAEHAQVIDAGTVLQPCRAEAKSDEPDGTDAVATRVASIVLPVAYRLSSPTQDLPAASLARGDANAYLPTCAFAVVRGIDGLRVRSSDVFSLTVPAGQSLREALPHLASRDAPKSVVDVRVSPDREGERATYRLRVPGIATYDVVARQADGVRLTWLSPSRTPAGRRLWRDVQASLAVRSPAAADGDADARSDDAAPEEATYEAIAFGPTTTGPPPAGFIEVTCASGRGVTTFWAPDRLTRGRTCSFSRQQRLQAELERLSVAADVDAPLRETYEAEMEFELDAGDDATSDLEYDNDAAGPGGLRAESLVYTAYNDGRPRETHIVQAGGVRVSWSVLPGGWGPQAGELTSVLESLRVSRSGQP